MVADILMPEKVDEKGVLPGLKSNFVMTKRSIHQLDRIMLNVYALNNIAKNSRKEKVSELKMNKSIYNEAGRI